MKEKDVLLVLVSSFIVTIAWIGFNLYNKHARSTISEALQMQIVPIPSQFDTQIIEELKTREKVEPLYQVIKTEPSAEGGEILPQEKVATASGTPTPTTTPKVTPTVTVTP